MLALAPGHFLYFAYGSNMLAEWMCSTTRCPGARRVGTASALGFDLVFCKRSKDGSGKATLVSSSDAQAEVQGALYAIPDSERDALRRTERGYDEFETFAVRSSAGEALSAVTYIAPAKICDASLVPFDWYVELVTLGAGQSGLAVAYTETLRAVRRQPDLDPVQASPPRAILEKAARAIVNAGC